MSIALAVLLVMSASLLSGVVEQRRERRVRHKAKNRSANGDITVRVTVDRGHFGDTPEELFLQHRSWPSVPQGADTPPRAHGVKTA